MWWSNVFCWGEWKEMHFRAMPWAFWLEKKDRRGFGPTSGVDTDGDVLVGGFVAFVARSRNGVVVFSLQTVLLHLGGAISMLPYASEPLHECQLGAGF
jgi:hypothetical protein